MVKLGLIGSIVVGFGASRNGYSGYFIRLDSHVVPLVPRYQAHLLVTYPRILN